jgi:hypothetical protein
MSVAAESLDIIALRSDDAGSRGVNGGIMKISHLLLITHHHDKGTDSISRKATRLPASQPRLALGIRYF